MIFLTACSSNPSIINSPEKQTVVPVNKVSPFLETKHLGELGDPILSMETGSYVTKRSKSVTLLSGIQYQYSEQPGLNKGSTVNLVKGNSGQNAACFDQAQYRSADVLFCLYDMNMDGFFDYGTFGGSDIDNLKARYKVTTVENRSAATDYLKKQLVYRGVSADKLLFSYIEFSGKLNEPTLSQDFSIDFQKNTHVLFGYKGARFKVEQADNMNIQYQVLAYFR